MRKGIAIPKIGDIYEVNLTKGVAYAQYVLRHTAPPSYGFVLRVFPGAFAARPIDLDEICSRQEQFLAFYSIPTGLNDGFLVKVDFRTVSDRFLSWPMFKNKPGSKWQIWDGHEFTIEDPLKVEHYDLSIMEIIPRSDLLAKIESGWHPSDEVFAVNPKLRNTYQAWKRREGKPD